MRSPKYSLATNNINSNPSSNHNSNHKEAWTEYGQKVLSPGSKTRNINPGIMSNTNYNNFNNMRMEDPNKGADKKQVVKIFQKKSSN